MSLIKGAIAPLLILSACSGNMMAQDGGDSGPAPFDLTADLKPPACSGSSLFTAIKAEILPHCDGTGCHRTAPLAAGLDLTDANAYANLINVTASKSPDLVRVKPGAPADSFLWRKLDNLLPMDNSLGQPMPLGAEFFWYPLSESQRAQIYCWILAGALNN